MKTMTINVYAFNELSENAKQKARHEYRIKQREYFWLDEGFDSLKAFCHHFGVALTDWSVGTCSYSWVATNANKDDFRGVKLKTINRDYMPTGYCMDCSLWITFYDVFKASGNALLAFNEAIEQWVKDMVSDMEYQDSDEYIDEHMTINEYEFNEHGEQV